MRKTLSVILLLVVPVFCFAQVRARYDISEVTYVDDSTWYVYGEIFDPTGSYNAGSISVGDRIIQRGFDSTSVTVYDRFRIVVITTDDVIYLGANVRYDETGSIKNNAGMPLSGSFPICRVLPNTKTMVKPSWYQEQFDPDYDAAIDNLNSEENQTYPPFVYEISSDNQINITIPFKLKQSSKVFYNGVVIREGQWSGVGTNILTVNFSTKVYDFLFITN